MLLTLVIIVVLFLGLSSAVHAILRTRTPQGAIAWVVSLLSMPVLAVPAYWVFGRSRFNGYVNAWQDTSEQMQENLDKLLLEFEPYRVEAPETLPEYAAIKKLSNFQFVKGNSTELLVDGPDTFRSIEDGIEAARDYILFQFYILRSDKVGSRFQQQLIRKAGQGLKVLVLYDELGSSSLDRNWIAELQAAGIEIFQQ